MRRSGIAASYTKCGQIPIKIVPRLMGVKIILPLFIPGLNVLGVNTCVEVDKMLAMIDRFVIVCQRATDPAIAPQPSE